MTHEEHRRIHVELHQALGFLVGDWLNHNLVYGAGEPKTLCNTTIFELMEWSHRQTIDPEDLCPAGE